MSLDEIEQKAKTIVEAAYKLKQQDKKMQDETKKYIAGLVESITRDLETERKSLE